RGYERVEAAHVDAAADAGALCRLEEPRQRDDIGLLEEVGLRTGIGRIVAHVAAGAEHEPVVAFEQPAIAEIVLDVVAGDERQLVEPRARPRLRARHDRYLVPGV